MSKQFKTRPDKVNNKNALGDERYLQFSIISVIEVFFMAFPMLAYLYVRYQSRDAYGDFSGVLLILGMVAVLGILLLRGKKILQLQDHYLRSVDQILKFIILTMLLVVSLGAIWFMMGATMRFGLSKTDLYFYFIGTAIIEELFFRMFLCGTIKKILDSVKKRFPESAKILMISLISGISFMTIEYLMISLVSGSVFMIAHVQAYGNIPLALFSMFLGGFTFSMFYLCSRDISVSMTAHIIVNIIAVGNLIMVTGV